MARARTYSYAPPPKPLRSRGYDNLVVLTVLAIFIGCGLIAWEVWAPAEWGGYGSMKATTLPIPKVEPLPARPTTPAPPAPKTGPVPGPGPAVPPGPGPAVPPAPGPMPPGGM